jgi:uncharacterized protein YjbI with pentapeptide repeats
MTAKRTNRMLWGLTAVLGGVVLGCIGLLFVRLKPYWLAKYQGAGADLARAYLPGANLRGAELGNANLQQAVLSGADLRGSNLSLCCRHDADRLGSAANLQGAILRNANLSGADLMCTNLKDADLRGAILQHAFLMDTNFESADLRGAALRNASIFRVRLLNARYNVSTRWTSGFHPERHGARLVR